MSFINIIWAIYSLIIVGFLLSAYGIGLLKLTREVYGEDHLVFCDKFECGPSPKSTLIPLDNDRIRRLSGRSFRGENIKLDPDPQVAARRISYAEAVGYDYMSRHPSMIGYQVYLEDLFKKTESERITITSPSLSEKQIMIQRLFSFLNTNMEELQCWTKSTRA